MKLKELVHYEVDSKNLTHQQKLSRLLLSFLAIMLVLTVISRAADSLTVAQVKVESAKSGAIEHSVQVDGTLTANREVAMLAQENVLVEQVHVYEGAAVKKGDVLFQLNMDDLKKQLEKKQLEVQKLQLTLKEYELKKETSEVTTQKKAEKEQTRADEDYDNTMEDAAEKVRRAEKARDDASDKLDAFREDYDWDDRDDWKYSVGESGDMETRNGMGYTEAKAKFEELKTAWESARQDLKDAQRAQELAVLDAERKLEDAEAENEDEPDLTPEKTALEIQSVSMGMEDLRKAIAAEGKIISQTDGVVTKLNVSTGNKTSAEASAVIAESSEGYRLKAPLDSEQAKLVTRGDKVEVTLSGKTKATKTAVDSITPSSTVTGGVDILMLLDEGEIGQTATVRISKRSESYQQCLPIEAVRGSEGSQYVLVVDEKDTVLGKQKVARQIPVTVDDKNETRAGLAGSALQSSDKVIVSSSKNIFAGDRVRLLES